MKYTFFLILILLVPKSEILGWGKTGHRAIGLIAEMHMTKKARKNLKAVMGNESLAMSSTWMDFIRSDSKWDYATPWHYCTIPDGMTYEEAGTPDEGDAIVTINRLISELESGELTGEDELVAIRFLVHLVGDIHQPLHVGNGTDRGGNDVKVKWFWQNTNLHSVWDSRMIDGENLSYTELANSINFASEAQAAEWQNDTVLDWTDEAMALRDQVYNLPEDNSLSYRYVFDNWSTVENQLLKAGIRLAGILNKIYG